MNEVNQAAEIISKAADADAEIIFGAVIDETLVDQIKITVIATGFDETRQRLKDISGRVVRPAVSEPVTDDQNNIDKPGFVDPKDDGNTELDIPAFLRQGR